MVADYNFYTTTYGGTLDEAAFRRAAVKAEAYLRQITMGRCERPDLPQAVDAQVKLALCAMTERLAAEDEAQAAQAAGISSESNDGISVHYSTRTARQIEEERYAVASAYLAWTGLLYRGCCG